MLVLLNVMTGLMAGVYFTFSIVVMKALNELPPLQAAVTMNKINDIIVNTLFLPVFFISTLWHAGLIVWSFADWQTQHSILVIAAAIIYIVGMFGVTVFGNVPLNNRLKLSADDHSLSQRWNHYYRHWIRLNHIRMMSCIFACALLSVSLNN